MATSAPPSAPADSHPRRVPARPAPAIALRSLLVAACVVIGGASWKQARQDEDHRQLHRPLAVTGVVWQANGERSYSLTIDDSLWLDPRVGGPVRPVDGRVMHMFLVGENGAFAHLHPVMSDSTSFTTALPLLPAGRYRVFADVVHENGFARTLATTLDLAPAKRVLRSNPDPDDGWSAKVEPAADGVAPLAGGATLRRLDGRRPLVAGGDAVLRFALREADGSAGRVQPYFGMAGRAVVMRRDGGVHAHLRPRGATSQSSPATLDAGRIEFPYAFPSAGDYSVWVQLRRGGVVETARFDVTVMAGTSEGAR